MRGVMVVVVLVVASVVVVMMIVVVIVVVVAAVAAAVAAPMEVMPLRRCIWSGECLPTLACTRARMYSAHAHQTLIFCVTAGDEQGREDSAADLLGDALVP